MTYSEMRCKNMADVCRLAHIRTERDCKKANVVMDAQDKEGETVYTAFAQGVFDRHYDYICNVTGI
jgi:hypothetical protein